MEKGKFADLTTEQLQKKKKYASILMVILVAAIVLNGAALIYDMVNGEGFDNTLFIPAIACMGVLIPIYLGKKNIEEELKSREDQ